MVLSRVCDFVLKTAVSGACFVASGTWFVVVLEHLAVHAVFYAEDFEELLGRDGLAYLLVVDGVESCHFSIEACYFQETFLVCLLIALGGGFLLEAVDAHVYLSLLVLVLVVDGEEGFCLFLGKAGFFGDEALHALAEFLFVEACGSTGHGDVTLVLGKCQGRYKCKYQQYCCLFRLHVYCCIFGGVVIWYRCLFCFGKVVFNVVVVQHCIIQELVSILYLL